MEYENEWVAKATHPQYVENVTRMSNSMENRRRVNVATLLQRLLARNVKGSYQWFFFLLSITPFGKAMIERTFDHRIKNCNSKVSVTEREMVLRWQFVRCSYSCTLILNFRHTFASVSFTLFMRCRYTSFDTTWVSLRPNEPAFYFKTKQIVLQEVLRM